MFFSLSGAIFLNIHALNPSSRFLLKASTLSYHFSKHLNKYMCSFTLCCHFTKGKNKYSNISTPMIVQCFVISFNAREEIKLKKRRTISILYLFFSLIVKPVCSMLWERKYLCLNDVVLYMYSPKQNNWINKERITGLIIKFKFLWNSSGLHSNILGLNLPCWNFQFSIVLSRNRFSIITAANLFLSEFLMNFQLCAPVLFCQELQHILLLSLANPGQ